MQTTVRLFAAALLASVCLGSTAFGQSRRVVLSFQGGGAGHEENNLNVGLAAGFGLAVPLMHRLSVAFEADSWGTRSQTSHRKLYNGRLRVRPFLLGLRYEFEGNGYFSPYAVAGVGYIETKFWIGTLPAVPDVTIDQTVRSGWAGYFGAGIAWRLSGFWDFFAEIDYLIRTAPAKTFTQDVALGLTTDEIWVNLHVVYLKLGLRLLL
ncbi:MAG: outer membrane beta-barrel protein [Candidatus Aminicenantes bacterium]|nr:outer membrane beta-barrel protein [Candidatus Aminicenantes bacterium]